MAESKERFPDNFQFFINGMSKLHMAFFDQHLRMRRFPHTTAPVATDPWSKELFPDSDSPLASLWQVIAHAVDGFRERQEILEKRRAFLDSLEIRELHVTGGGNDLRISLSERAEWHHATLKTKSGQASSSNFSSDEICTVPDCRVTEGRLVASKAFRLFNHALVEGLSLEFRDGRVVDVQADTGKESFEAWTATDSGSSMLGEIGLVGSDAPLYGMKRYFDFLSALRGYVEWYKSVDFTCPDDVTQVHIRVAAIEAGQEFLDLTQMR